MQYGDNQPCFAWFRPGDGNGEETSSGTRRSIQSATAVPSTVLVTNMSNRSLVLQCWRDGPTAYLSPADAAPLRRVLSAIFENTALALAAKKHDAR